MRWFSLLTEAVNAKNPRQVLLALCDNFLLSYFLQIAAQQQQHSNVSKFLFV